MLFHLFRVDGTHEVPFHLLSVPSIQDVPFHTFMLVPLAGLVTVPSISVSNLGGLLLLLDLEDQIPQYLLLDLG